MNTAKLTIKIAAGLILTLLTGCVVTSVYPFYTPKDVVFDPALVGNWVDAGATNETKETWQFKPGDGQAYRFTLVDADKKTEYDAHLFKLKGQLFLDCLPRERHDDFVPPHYLLKVNRLQPNLEMQILDYKWLTDLVEKNPKAIRHLVVSKPSGESGEGTLVLTADTAELQKFLLTHLKTKEAFGADALIMKRQ
jgi:hypothetical protein